MIGLAKKLFHLGLVPSSVVRSNPQPTLCPDWALMNYEAIYPRRASMKRGGPHVGGVRRRRAFLLLDDLRRPQIRKGLAGPGAAELRKASSNKP